MDERNKQLRDEYPLRKVPLDLCICGHGDEDHQTEQTLTGVIDGACAKCVCSVFRLPEGETEGV